ncbi:MULTISPECIES: hypothetical protein [Sphingomonas]|uniref:hypothetical protein n=1 Tax=Sphingomonas TaxID=13687 RepID=UPI000834D162|nr:hypothetical protein [Sphingomonas sp. CCH10-B3]
MTAQRWLVIGGWLSIGAALLHLGCIVGGADWYRFFGAPPLIVRAVERGQAWPHLATLVIAAVLCIWAAYAFSGAGLISRLPLLRLGLVVISAIYVWRSLDLPIAMVVIPQAVSPFVIWSSLIVAIYALCYSIGTWQAWRTLGRKEQN